MVGVNPLGILLVEDNAGDVRLILEALAGDDRVHIENAKTADAAWRCLEAGTVDLILLDLNLPTEDGHALLQRIKNDPRLRRIPAVVLTSSSARSDVERAYDALASGYVVKASDYFTLAKRLRAVIDYWSDVVVLPPRVDRGS